MILNILASIDMAFSLLLLVTGFGMRKEENKSSFLVCTMMCILFFVNAILLFAR